MRTQERKERDTLEIGNGRCDDLPRRTTQHAKDGLFARSMTPLGSMPADTPRFVSPLSADEGLIDFHRSCKGSWNILCHERAQVMQHTLHTMTLDAGRFRDPHIRAITQEFSYDLFPSRQ